MKVTLNINLSDAAERLLVEISSSEEPDDYSFDIFGPEMDELNTNGLVDSIEGEQFYLSRLGEEYLKQKK